MKTQLQNMSNQLLDQTADNIHELRKHRKIKQSDLASSVDLSHRHLQKIEAGDVDLKISNLEKFANVLNVPACYLVNDRHTGCLAACGVLCPQEILGQLDIIIQINKLDGTVVYRNKHEQKKSGRPEYIWDHLVGAEEIDKLKNYLKFVVKDRPAPTPYFTKLKSRKQGVVPIKADWKYIFDGKQTLTSILSIITKHPSW